MFCDNVYDLHGIFSKLIVIRDHLANRTTTMFDSELPKPYFNGTRIQYYPSGGGFMSIHTDTTAVTTASTVSSSYIQLVMLLSQRESTITVEELI